MGAAGTCAFVTVERTSRYYVGTVGGPCLLGESHLPFVRISTMRSISVLIEVFRPVRTSKKSC